MRSRTVSAADDRTPGPGSGLAPGPCDAQTDEGLDAAQMTPTLKPPRWQRFLQAMPARYGVAQSVIGVTTCVTLASVVISALFNLLSPWPHIRGSLVVATLVPLVITPPICWAMVTLVDALNRAQAALRHVADHDVLTEAHTRRYFLRHATEQLERDASGGREDSVVLLDIDDFKCINDRFGHPTGDAVLREVSKVCRCHLRDQDVFARYGGEEFVMLLPGATPTQARAIVERIRVAIASIALRSPTGEPVPVSASFGIAGSRGRLPAAATPRTASALDDTLAAADGALYAAKRGGKNQSVVESPGEAVTTSRSEVFTS